MNRAKCINHNHICHVFLPADKLRALDPCRGVHSVYRRAWVGQSGFKVQRLLLFFFRFFAFFFGVSLGVGGSTE